MYRYILVYTCTYVWSLARTVVRIAPQHNFTDLMQDAVGLSEIPPGLFAGLVWQVSLEKVEEINSLLVQFRQL